MKQILVVSSYPAPYRVAVFQGLAEYYQMDVFFEFDQDQSRNREWFVKGKSFTILNSENAKQRFQECLRHIDRYDLVLAYDYLNQNARAAMRRCIREKVPYFVNCDGAFIRPHWLKDPIKRYYVSHAAACLASGRFARNYFLRYGAEKERIYEHRFTSLTEEDILTECISAQEKRSRRKSLELEAREMVLSIGQFIPRKGFDILLKAWERLDNQYQLVLIGGGDLDRQYRETIKQSRFEHVSVLEFMNKERLYQYFLAADVFALPTREDIWGLVINEAMGCGLPVVSTDGCIAAMELVEEGAGGCIVPTGDAQALADCLLEVLGDETRRQRMGETNRQRMEGCTLDHIVESHREVIEEVL